MSTNPSIYRIGWLGRLPLKTPYPAVIARIQYIMSRLPRGTDLVVDFGGVGRGIYNMITDSGLDAIGVTMTGGFDVHWTGQTVTVPKSTLVSKLVARLHAGELFVHGDLGRLAGIAPRTGEFPTGGDTGRTGDIFVGERSASKRRRLERNSSCSLEKLNFTELSCLRVRSECGRLLTPAHCRDGRRPIS